MILDRSKQSKRVPGNISLTTVILVGALLIVSGMSLLANAIDITMGTKSYFNRTMADVRVSTCLEEGMNKLTKLPTFTGVFSVTYSDGSCQVTIADISGQPTKKSIAMVAVYGTYTIQRTKTADTSTSPMSVSN